MAQRKLGRIASRANVRDEFLLRDQIIALQVAQTADRFGERPGRPLKLIEKASSFRALHVEDYRSSDHGCKR